jgi:formylglycine-generating enzyme required for sulfatase activity
MGADESDRYALADESPRHRVEISRDFYIGKSEVTQKHWEKIMGSNPSRHQYEDAPVDSVSHEDALLFIEKLNDWCGSVDPPHRLPTEAEWEYVARSGTDTRYFFGDSPENLGKYAFYGENSYGRSQRAGDKAYGPSELYDVYGNLAEWVGDWYDPSYYLTSPVIDPRGPASGSRRVLRGCDYMSTDVECRSSARFNREPDFQASTVGLRLALEMEP